MNLQHNPIILLISLVLCLVTATAAQPVHSFEMPLRSTGDFLFYLDACQFEAQPGRTRLEISYAMALLPADGLDTLSVQIDLFLSSKSQVYADLSEKKNFPVPRDSQFTFIDMKKFELSADTVALRMTVRDSSSGRMGEVEATLLVRDFQPVLSLSDISFIGALHRPEAERERNFLRHGLIMVPDPSRIFFNRTPGAVAWFYFETNHLQFSPDEQRTYLLKYTVSELSGVQVVAQERPGLPVTQANTARVEKIPLDRLPAGLYRLDLFLTEQFTGSSTTASRYFTVYTGETGDQPLLSMTPKDQERYLEQMRYIASREEKELFKKLDIKGKQQFIIRFWQSKDPTPETPENEFMIDYFRRLGDAEKKFKGGSKADMARIYIQYGVPMDVERKFSNTQYNKPVEIWTYAVNGGTDFVFVDRNNDGRYVLVHSTHPDEYSNPEWERDVK